MDRQDFVILKYILRNISLPQGFRAGILVYSRRYTRLLVTGKTFLRLGASSELPNSSKVLTPGFVLPTLSVSVYFGAIFGGFCLIFRDFGARQALRGAIGVLTFQIMLEYSPECRWR